MGRVIAPFFSISKVCSKSYDAMKYFLLLTILFSLASGVFGQTSAAAIEAKKPEFEAEMKLAQLTLEAHGGAKLKAMKTLVMRGSVDVSTAAFAQPMAATFITIYSGDKYRLEIDNPLQPSNRSMTARRPRHRCGADSRCRRSIA
jgi:hypothetical protein